jgi:hypothetical protein
MVGFFRIGGFDSLLISYSGCDVLFVKLEFIILNKKIIDLLTCSTQVFYNQNLISIHWFKKKIIKIILF